MNKHVRAVHGANKKRRGAVPTEAIEDDVSTAIRDLAKDPDLEEVVLRVRAKNRQRITPITDDEEAALRYVRERRPGAGKKRRVRRKDGASDSDEFDEGAAKRYPVDRTVEAYMLDENRETEVPVMSRSRWQAKYIMAKAKLMLVDEENKMRRDELTFWQALYATHVGKDANSHSNSRGGDSGHRGGGRSRRHVERERERERDPIEDILSDEDDIKVERRR